MTPDEELQSAESGPEPEIILDEGQHSSRNLRRYLAALPWTVIAAVVSVVLLLVLIAFLFPPNYWRF